MEQIQKIYTGESTNWKEVGGSDEAIIVVNREEGSGTRSAFEEIVLGKLTNTNSSLIEQTTDAVLQTVSAIKGAIGYISYGSLDPQTVKALSVDNVSCTVEQIRSDNYKVQRPFLMITKTAPADAVKSFID
jgi:phosphate transport system substrate-binding protein